MKAYMRRVLPASLRGPAASEKNAGHMGGKVLIPTARMSAIWIAARLAADVWHADFCVGAHRCGKCKLITADVDERDREFITGERTAEGFFASSRQRSRPLHQACIAFAENGRSALVGNLDAEPQEAKGSPRPCTRSYPGKMRPITARRR